ncbi:MAG: hypothetical protein ABH816_00785 [Candidatus Levyibacteriota bacterium]
MSYEAISARLIAGAVRYFGLFSQRSEEAPQFPRPIEPAKGMEKEKLKKRCQLLVVKNNFGGKDWNEFCSSMIGLLGGVQENAVTQRSNYLTEFGTALKIAVFRLKGPQHDRGVIYFLPEEGDLDRDNYNPECIETIRFGCDQNVFLSSKDEKFASSIAGRVFKAYLYL